MKKILVAVIVAVAIVAGIGLFAAPVLAGGLFRSGTTQLDATPPCCTTTAPVAAGCCSGGAAAQTTATPVSEDCCNK
ncbi:MAG: hypothetical protein C4542_02360 [Dehalococcoidia bacterium]|nr:MAG: hypothetical protein C4542_02360 [Dehalococcoidia bacterium]